MRETLFEVNGTKEYCYFCGSECRHNENFVQCPLCGKYFFDKNTQLKFKDYRNETASYLYFYHLSNPNRQFSYIRLINEQEILGEYERLIISLQEIKSDYPIKFSEKINRFILALTRKAKLPVNKISLSFEELANMCCITRLYDEKNLIHNSFTESQIFTYLSYLCKIGVIGAYYNNLIGFRSFDYEILPEAWIRAEKLEKTDTNNRQVFVSMSFAEKTKNSRESIRKGVVEAGFIPYFIDEDVHNKQIVPYMLKQIRDSRFLIMETTDSNYGAYYEAGYAEGLGKQVIICCRKDAFDKKKNELIHFDIAQKQLLLWEDENDLEMQLAKWIKTLLGSN